MPLIALPRPAPAMLPTPALPLRSTTHEPSEAASGQSSPLVQMSALLQQTAACDRLRELSQKLGERAALPSPVQAAPDPSPIESAPVGRAVSADQIHAAARHGTSGAGGPLPFREIIERSFAPHDVSGIVAHTDAQAALGAESMGARAFATGSHIAFARAPDLHTTAHEVAHVVQQRGGLSLPDGVGTPGDVSEEQADAAAAQVVQGRSAGEVLGPPEAGGGALPVVQMLPTSISLFSRLARYGELFRDPTKKPAVDSRSPDKVKKDVRALQARLQSEYPTDGLAGRLNKLAPLFEALNDPEALTEEQARGLERQLQERLRGLTAYQGVQASAAAECKVLIQKLNDYHSMVAQTKVRDIQGSVKDAKPANLLAVLVRLDEVRTANREVIEQLMASDRPDLAGEFVRLGKDINLEEQLIGTASATPLKGRRSPTLAERIIGLRAELGGAFVDVAQVPGLGKRDDSLDDDTPIGWLDPTTLESYTKLNQTRKDWIDGVEAQADPPSLAGLQSLTEVGKGAEGEISLFRAGKQHFAGKTTRSEARENLLREYAAYRAIGAHENLPTVYGMAAVPFGQFVRPAMMMQSINGVSGQVAMEQLTAARTAGRVTEQDYWGAMQYIARTLLSVVAHLDSKGISHNDIKPENTMIDEQGKLIVIDLGLHTRHDEEAIGGDLAFASPEVRSKTKTGIKSDLFLIGTTIIAGVEGFKRGSGAWNPKDGLQGKRAPRAPEEVEQEAPGRNLAREYESFVNALTRLDANERPDLAAAREYPFIAQPLLDDPAAKRILQQSITIPQIPNPKLAPPLLNQAVKEEGGRLVPTQELIALYQAAVKEDAALSGHEAAILADLFGLSVEFYSELAPPHERFAGEYATDDDAPAVFVAPRANTPEGPDAQSLIHGLMRLGQGRNATEEEIAHCRFVLKIVLSDEVITGYLIQIIADYIKTGETPQGLEDVFGALRHDRLIASLRGEVVFTDAVRVIRAQGSSRRLDGSQPSQAIKPPEPEKERLGRGVIRYTGRRGSSTPDGRLLFLGGSRWIVIEPR